MQPLEQLLSSKNGSSWTKGCTEALNDLLSLVHQRLKLCLPDFQRPFHLYAEAGDGLFSAALLQDQGQGLVPIAMVARKCTITEGKRGELEQLLMATTWACRYLKRYLLFATTIYCYLPHAEQVRVVEDKEVHLRIRAYLLDLAFYQVVWRVGRTMFSQ